MSRELVQHGHEYDSSWITRPLNEDETTESALCGHSEKLAIAWNFVANPTTSEIQVTKNLRVCGDCRKWLLNDAANRLRVLFSRPSNKINCCNSSMQDRRSWWKSDSSLLHERTMFLQRPFLKHLFVCFCFLLFFCFNKLEKTSKQIFSLFTIKAKQRHTEW